MKEILICRMIRESLLGKALGLMAGGLLSIRQLFDPSLTPKVLEASEINETDEIYSGYLRLGNAIDSV